MYDNILVAVDPSHDARQDRALAVARKLAELPTSLITAITVVDEPQGFVHDKLDHDARVRIADAAMRELRKQVGEEAEIKTVVRHGKPAAEIVRYAEETGTDCVIVASHRPGLKDYLLGSTAARVVRHAPCTVIVLR